MTTITKRTTTPITWDEIQANKNTLAVGDEITETLKTGENVTFVVAGLNVYNEGEVIFTLKDCLNERHCMNEDWTNKGGWAASAMRQYLNTEIIEQLPDELQAVICSRVIGEAVDKLWLFSEREIFGDESWVENETDCGVQLPYYQTPSNRVKTRNGSAIYWWERSPYASNSTFFCFVTSGGIANVTSASNTNGVCFGFCI